jgi:hypothetical protein
MPDENNEAPEELTTADPAGVASAVADDESGSNGGEPSSAPPRRGRPPRRIVLPSTADGADPSTINVGLQFVKERPKAKAEPKQTAWEEIQSLNREEQERYLSRLAETVHWTIKRIGPHEWRGRRVPLGIFADQECAGPVTIPIIKQLLGGGEYQVTLDDATSARATWFGPYKVLGAPRFNIGASEDNEEDDGVPADFRVATMLGKEAEDEEWITTYDSRLGGYIKRRKKEIEQNERMRMYEDRDKAQTIDPLLQARLDAMAKQSEDMARAITALAAVVAAPKGDDSMTKFMEMERQRLSDDKAAKVQELLYLREKLDADRKDAEANRKHEAEKAEASRKHEVEQAEKRFEAEKARIAEDRKSAEARLAADKAALEARMESENKRLAQDRQIAEERLEAATKLSEEKLEKAHEMVMAMMKEKQNPLENFMGLLTTVREVGEIINPAAPGADESEKPKSIVEKLFEKAADGISKAWPTFEPVLQQRFRDMLAESQQAGQLGFQPPRQIGVTQPQAPRPATKAAQQQPQPQPQPQPKAAPRPRPQEPMEQPSAGPTPPDPAMEAMIVKGVGEVIAEISASIERNLPPKMSWEGIQQAYPMIAPQLKAYGTPEQMAQELMVIAATPQFGHHAAVIADVAGRIVGSARPWAEGFLAAVHGRPVTAK